MTKQNLLNFNEGHEVNKNELEDFMNCLKIVHKIPLVKFRTRCIKRPFE